LRPTIFFCKKSEMELPQRVNFSLSKVPKISKTYIKATIKVLSNLARQLGAFKIGFPIEKIVLNSWNDLISFYNMI